MRVYRVLDGVVIGISSDVLTVKMYGIWSKRQELLDSEISYHDEILMREQKTCVLEFYDKIVIL